MHSGLNKCAIFICSNFFFSFLTKLSRSSVKEVLALLIVAGGNKVTARGLWKTLYEYKGIKYNSSFFTERINDMKSELEFFQVSDIIYTGRDRVRFCRMNRDAIVCDYYEMLDGRLPCGEEKDFLPEYEWASGFYQKDWTALFEYWKNLKC